MGTINPSLVSRKRHWVPSLRAMPHRSAVCGTAGHDIRLTEERSEVTCRNCARIYDTRVLGQDKRRKKVHWMRVTSDRTPAPQCGMQGIVVGQRIRGTRTPSEVTCGNCLRQMQKNGLVSVRTGRWPGSGPPKANEPRKVK